MGSHITPHQEPRHSMVMLSTKLTLSERRGGAHSACQTLPVRCLMPVPSSPASPLQRLLLTQKEVQPAHLALHRRTGGEADWKGTGEEGERRTCSGPTLLFPGTSEPSNTVRSCCSAPPGSISRPKCSDREALLQVPRGLTSS